MVCNQPNLQGLCKGIIFPICSTQTNELYSCFLWNLDARGFEIIYVTGATGVGRICTEHILYPDGVEFVEMIIWQKTVMHRAGSRERTSCFLFRCIGAKRSCCLSSLRGRYQIQMIIICSECFPSKIKLFHWFIE